MIDLIDRIVELVTRECTTTTAKFVAGVKTASIDAHGKAVVRLVNGIRFEYFEQVGNARRWEKRIVTTEDLKRSVKVVWAGKGWRWDDSDIPFVFFSDVLAIIDHASHGVIQLK